MYNSGPVLNHAVRTRCLSFWEGQRDFVEDTTISADLRQNFSSLIDFFRRFVKLHRLERCDVLEPDDFMFGSVLSNKAKSNNSISIGAIFYFCFACL